MKKQYKIVFSVLLISVLFLSCTSKKNADLKEKELYLPAEVSMVPDSNDYNNPESEFCFQRMIQSDNMALFWHKEYGDDPMANPDTTRRFDPETALIECERFYDYYVDELKLVQKGNSLIDSFKMLIFVFGGDNATAFGGGAEEKVGILWTPAVRINKQPYGALAHEMAHSFQYVSRNDCGVGPRGPIMEMSAQYMLWQVYPEWMTFENYHLVDYLKQTHYAFLHPVNMYHSPYVLEYWSEKHGKTFFGELSRSTQEGEDPVATYKRLNSLSQEQFNDEIFDAARRFITWDLKRVEKEAHQYANQHTTTMVAANDGWYQIDSTKCPQNYGYNGIRLNVPAPGTELVLNFKGIAGSDGYSAVKTDNAGWRYGFLASLNDGSRVYGDVYHNAEGTASFKVPENTEYLWLVVSGAPTEHWPIVFRRRRDAEKSPEEQWPYQIKLSGTTINNSAIKSI
ncbi:DUF6055 domain-containing protein [Maribellus mangrovi]|uniref:DUF6055 domain-containing protein n=1 Tax=Maribellus mangrovi TaxID=3133146 RepID=UPI0030EC285C